MVQADLAAQPVVAQSQYKFQHFDTRDGLSSEYIRSIAQDGLGFIWTQSGSFLSRFDGYNFKVFSHDPDDTLRSPPFGTMGRIVADPLGNIWVTMHTPTHDFPLAKYDIRTGVFIKYKPSVAGEIVNAFSFDKTHPIIWFATAGEGLYSFNLQTLETKNHLNNHTDSLIKSRRNDIQGISDRDSCLLIATAEGLWKFDKNARTFSRPACNPADSSVLYSTEVWNIDEGLDNDPGDVWLWLDRNLLKLDKNLSVVKRLDFPAGVRLGFFMHYSTDYARDKEGIFWFTTFEHGLYRYDPKDNSFINIKAITGDANSLKSNRMNSILVDRDQNVWLATPQGISRLPKQGLRFYNFNLPVAESTVFHTGKQDFVIISKIERDAGHEIMISPIIPDHPDSLNFKPLTAFKATAIHGMWQGKRNFWISAYGQGIARLALCAVF